MICESFRASPPIAELPPPPPLVPPGSSPLPPAAVGAQQRQCSTSTSTSASAAASASTETSSLAFASTPASCSAAALSSRPRKRFSSSGGGSGGSRGSSGGSGGGSSGAAASSAFEGKQKVVDDKGKALSRPATAPLEQQQQQQGEEQQEQVSPALGEMLADELLDLLFADVCHPAAPIASKPSIGFNADDCSNLPLLCCNTLERDGGAFGCILSVHHQGAHSFAERKPRNRPAAWLLQDQPGPK